MTPSPSQPTSFALGIACILTSLLALTAHDAVAKLLLVTMLPLVLMGCRYTFQAVATTGLMLWQAKRTGGVHFCTRQPWLQVVRGVLVVCSSGLALSALQRIPISEFTAICCLTPLLVTVIARVALKERVTPMRWLMVLGGLTGALLVVRPGGSVDSVGALLSLAVVVSYAIFQTLTAYMARKDSAQTTLFYTSWIGALALSVLVFVTSSWQTEPTQWGLLLTVAVLGTVGQYLMIVAFSNAPASVLSPYLYTAIAMATFVGWWVFGQVPDGLAILGMVLIGACGVGAVYLVRRE